MTLEDFVRRQNAFYNLKTSVRFCNSGRMWYRTPIYSFLT